MARKSCILRDGATCRIQDLKIGDECQFIDTDGALVDGDPGFWTVTAAPHIDEREPDADGPRWSVEAIPTEHHAAWLARQAVTPVDEEG
jgi:hypothetical protein